MIVCFGELMLRLEPASRQRLGHGLPGLLSATFAGAEANAAVAVAQLGGAARFVTTLPANHPAASAAVRELTALGVAPVCIVSSDTGRLGLYYYESGALAREASVTYDRSHSAFALAPPASYDWEVLLTGATRLHLSGITPAVSALACAAAHDAVNAATRRGIPVSLDINFRSALWRWSGDREPAQLAAHELSRIAAHADVLFAGPADAALLLGITTPPTPEAAFHTLHKRFPLLQHLACSHRGEDVQGRAVWSGRLHEVKSGRTFTGPEFVVIDLVDRLGVGDAFAGALLHALSLASCDPGRALALATAAGAIKHGLPGDYLRASLSEVEAALSGARADRVRR